MPLNDYLKYQPYLDFCRQYAASSNPATGSKVDSNANIHQKNITTCEGELFKKDFIGINRLAMHQRLSAMYGTELADQYISDLEHHLIYRHDETAVIGKPYCVSITLYPFLFHGVTGIGGISDAPKNLHGFAGGFINLVFAIASQFAGAVSTPEFLPYLDYFIRKEYGDDYPVRCVQSADVSATAHLDCPIQTMEVVDQSNKRRTLDKVITDVFEQVVYSLNQPAAARNYQSVFWNIAYFDRPYFNGLFEHFRFPDGTPMNWDSVNWLQKRFMRWFNDERLRKMLTFPVETLNLLDNGHEYVDQEWKQYAAEMWARGHSFFVYRSDSVDSLASCCRLRNELQDNTFSYTLGAGGISTGSKCVMTINLNRFVQDLSRQMGLVGPEDISDALATLVPRIHKYLAAFNDILNDRLAEGMLPVYDAGFISLEKQFLTIGINGFVEAAEYLGIPIRPDDDTYKMFAEAVLKPIYEANKAARTKELMFNCEFVPAESLGVKNAMWDQLDGYESWRECYNSYFYRVEDSVVNMLDKLMLHGKAFTRYLDGGSALHMNLDEHLSAEQYEKLLDAAIITGCAYLTFNIPNTICNECGNIDKNRLRQCPACGSADLDYATRVIGYLARVSSFAEGRQLEAAHRHYVRSESCVCMPGVQ